MDLGREPAAQTFCKADQKDGDTGKSFIFSSKVVCVKNLFFLGGLPFSVKAFTCLDEAHSHY